MTSCRVAGVVTQQTAQSDASARSSSATPPSSMAATATVVQRSQRAGILIALRRMRRSTSRSPIRQRQTVVLRGSYTAAAGSNQAFSSGTARATTARNGRPGNYTLTATAKDSVGQTSRRQHASSGRRQFGRSDIRRRLCCRSAARNTRSTQIKGIVRLAHLSDLDVIGGAPALALRTTVIWASLEAMRAPCDLRVATQRTRASATRLSCASIGADVQIAKPRSRRIVLDSCA